MDNKITQRWIACPQSTGRAGKSTVADGIISWFTFAGIPYSALDADVQHHTLSDRHGSAVLDITNSEDEFHQMLETLPDSPAILVDFPGNRTAKILEYAAQFRMLDLFEAAGIRPTLLIFASDDETALDSALETKEHFGTRADYLLIENSAKFTSSSFKATRLYDWFIGLGTRTLIVPRIAQGALDAWQAAQHRSEEYLSLDKAGKAAGMSAASLLTITGFRDRLLAQCEDNASVLIPPNLSLIKNKVHRATVPETKTRKKLGHEMLVMK